MPTFNDILVYGYGNPGRQDDGLGVLLVNELEQWVEEMGIPGINFESNYQLNIEDAECLRQHDLVIFADASVEGINDVLLTRVTGENGVTFTTHSASPGYIYRLCEHLFGRTPETFLLHIRGYEWELGETVSSRALVNLEKAVGLMKEGLKNPSIFNELTNTKPKTSVNIK